MNVLSKLGLAVAGVATIGSVTTVFDANEAYAATLTGSLSFTGTAGSVNTSINPVFDTILLREPILGTVTGDFVGTTITFLEERFDLTLSAVLDGDNSDGMTSAEYDFSAIPIFLTLSNGYSFSLDAGSLLRLREQEGGSQPLVTVFGAGPLTGTFTNGSEVVAGLGSLTFTRVPGSSGYSASLSTVVIPTPALLPGLIGMGVAALRRKQNEESAEENS
jgi:hypothetical protein